MNDVIQMPNQWAPRPYQMAAWQYLQDGGKRAVCVWHRRAGKDLMSINHTATAAVQRVGLYWHLLPTYSQGRKIVWDGATRDGRKFLDAFPDEIVQHRHNVDMRLTLVNGSIFQVVGSDNVNRLMGANPIGCIFSEYSLQDPNAWEYIRPILAENGGWALFIYTARGRNHGYELLKTAQKNEKWFSEVLTADDTGAITREAIEEERESGMPEEMIQQEFYCSFDAPLVGAYFGTAMSKALADGRITRVPYEPLLEVHTAWDLGMADTTSIWFFQTSHNEIRLIDFFQNSGEGLQYYARILREKDYLYGDHYGPHDLQVREMGTGKSRLEVAKELGIKFKVAPHIGLDNGIEAVRNILPKCYFDSDKCSDGIEALRQYRKDWDSKKRRFRDQPIHDWSSHPADAFRMMAVSIKDRFTRKKSQFILPQYAVQNNYDPFGL